MKNVFKKIFNMKIAIFDVCDTIYNVNTTFFLDYYF